MKNKDPSIGYSIAYPFGVLGPILCIYFMTRIVKPKFPAKAQRFHMGEISIGPHFAGKKLEELTADILSDVQVTMIRKDGRNFVPTPDTVLATDDAVLVVAEREEVIAEAAAQLGTLEPGRLASDRADLDYIRVFVGKASVVGIPLASLPMPSGYPTHLLHVRRYDADLVPSPDLMLEFGDRVGVLTPPDRKEEIRRHFGDTVKAAAEFSYVSLGLGMVLGVLLGLIPIPIPGVGIVTLGIGGGPLIVALIFGKLRRTGPLLWTMPLPANIVLRNFGLAMFLATVGVNAGQPFVRTVAESGFTMLFIGVAILLTTVFIVLLVGHYVMKIPYDDLVGVASGATGNPAILVYSTKMAPTERPDIGYAMIFPSMTLVKVIAAQIVGLLVGGGGAGG
jgi:putative transport protein